METLDDYLLERIFRFATPVDLVRCSQTSHRFNHVITKFSSIQLRLHQHIYNSHHLSSNSHTSHTSDKGQLQEIIRFEKAFRDFQPRYSKFDIDPGHFVVAADGIHVLTRSRQPSIGIGDGYYQVYTLWTQQSGGQQWESKKLKVRFQHRINDSLIDLKNDLIILQKMTPDPGDIRFSPFHLLCESEELEPYSVSDLRIGPTNVNNPAMFNIGSSRSAYSLGPRNILQLRMERTIRLYDWQTGFSIGVLVIPETKNPHNCAFVGPDLLGVQITLSWTEYDGPHNGRRANYLLLYRIDELLLSAPSGHSIPSLALRLPSRPSHLPLHLPKTVKRKTRGPVGLHTCTLIGSTHSNDMIHIHFTYQDHYQRYNGSHLHDLMIRIPVENIEYLFESVRKHEIEDSTEYNDDFEFARLFPGVPILDPEEWRKYSSMSREPMPNDENQSGAGSRIFRYEQPRRFDDITERSREPVHIHMYDLNSEASMMQPRLGMALGGLGESLDLEVSEHERSVETTYSTMASNLITDAPRTSLPRPMTDALLNKVMIS
ncbi:uncharacterized protein IL334_005696 [Kwoniella shivajii]|uniref:F-box domain-containing protein n=1 Tax=Kwoniella shivajii TaxID=564305 RepID=A0ABZ1D4E6_9TREE|nr:hypothetical protein IL334_005696 [Kwoniella shivajii]